MSNREIARQFRQRCLYAGVSDCALRWISHIDDDDLARIEMAIQEASEPCARSEEVNLWREKDYRAKVRIGIIKDE